MHGVGATGLVPVRLCDVHPHVLAAAARREIRKAPDEAEDLLYAVVRPSSRTYWLPAKCAPMIPQVCYREAA
jgi:hypothetical protein